jgi:hypothetical protein
MDKRVIRVSNWKLQSNQSINLECISRSGMSFRIENPTPATLGRVEDIAEHGTVHIGLSSACTFLHIYPR